MSDENPRSEILRNCRQVGVLIFCTFAWVSILTFSPLDWPNGAVWPHAVPAHNACGLVGAWFSYQFVTYLGVGCYPLFFFLTLVTVMQLMKKSLSDLPLRALGGMLIVIITAASAALIDPHPSEGLVEGRGGVIGLALANFLRQNFDVFGSTLVVGFVYLLGFVLAAHELMTRVPALAHWLSETLVNVIASWRKAGQGRIKATPMLIGAGNHSSTATAKPARKKKAAKPEPEPEPEADEEEAGYDESEWEEDGEYDEDAEAEATAEAGGDRSAHIKLKSAVRGAPTIVDRADLDDIVYERCKELMTKVRQHLSSRGLAKHLVRGIVLTGGASAIQNQAPLAEAIFQVPARVGLPDGIDVLPQPVNTPEFVPLTGVVRPGFAYRAAKRSGRIEVVRGPLAGMLHGVTGFFGKYFFLGRARGGGGAGERRGSSGWLR